MASRRPGTRRSRRAFAKIERCVLRDRIDDLGFARRFLSGLSNRNQSDRNVGYDSDFAHAIKRLDRVIVYLSILDTETQSQQ
jgi:hypothetical protein